MSVLAEYDANPLGRCLGGCHKCQDVLVLTKSSVCRGFPLPLDRRHDWSVLAG